MFVLNRINSCHNRSDIEFGINKDNFGKYWAEQIQLFGEVICRRPAGLFVISELNVPTNPYLPVSILIYTHLNYIFLFMKFYQYVFI